MSTFTVLVASLGAFVTLVYHTSVWTAFGVAYMVAMLLVAGLAFLSRSQHRTGGYRLDSK